MPNLSDMYPSRWLTSKDLDGEDKTVTISRIEEAQIGGEDKWVLYFKRTETDKGLVLNQTNAKSIAKIHGDDSDEWIGKQIVLFPTEVQFKGDMVEAIRVRSKAPARVKKPVLTQAEADEVDDTPF